VLSESTFFGKKKILRMKELYFTILQTYINMYFILSSPFEKEKTLKAITESLKNIVFNLLKKKRTRNNSFILVVLDCL
jgi:hypothetical protein